MARSKPTSKGQRAGTRIKRKISGTSKPHNYNRDRKPKTTHDDDIVAEAKKQLGRMKKGRPRVEMVTPGEIEVIPSTNDQNANEPTTTTPSCLSDSINQAALAAGLTQPKIIAATVLAAGNTLEMAAAESGVTAGTVGNWKKQIPFRAFLNELTIGLVEETRGEAIRHLFQQLRGDSHKKMSEKDIFDWVKLALNLGGRAPGSNAPGSQQGSPSTSILHQHVHLAPSGPAAGSDDALLVNLQDVTRKLTGAERRQISQVLRAADA